MDLVSPYFSLSSASALCHAVTVRCGRPDAVVLFAEQQEICLLRSQPKLEKDGDHGTFPPGEVDKLCIDVLCTQGRHAASGQWTVDRW